ncbi:hypothetical protein [Chondrinema litorale]|uniref:hypothetical protein n=1 Tax=Chondrinema litorale TaxID=2994555 RepID=UPI002542AC82|nr:hypothetical protein [Chondrinema litorale]UZR96790.1 hypothetical protein OQ292_24125 [Chondrinema litorale]
MRTFNYYYIIFYDEVQDFTVRMNGFFNSFGLSSKLGKNNLLRVKDPLGNEYELSFYNFQKQIELANEKKESASQSVSVLPFQYLELKLLSSTYEKIANNKFNGLPKIAETVLVQILNKPIYYLNLIDEDDMNLLEANYKSQIMNRLEVAQLLERGEKPLPKELATSEEIPFNGFDIEIIRIEKAHTNNPLVAWQSMEEVIGEDGWGMTALPFTPIKINDFNESVNQMNYLDDMIAIIERELDNSFSILRMDWDIYRQECILFVEKESCFSGIWVSRMY